MLLPRALKDVLEWQHVQAACNHWHEHTHLLLPALQFEDDWHDEKLMDVLTQACQVIPRQPASSPSSAPAILERWRSRAGIEVTNEEPLQNAAWEVRGALFDLRTQPDACTHSVCALSWTPAAASRG